MQDQSGCVMWWCGPMGRRGRRKAELSAGLSSESDDVYDGDVRARSQSEAMASNGVTIRPAAVRWSGPDRSSDFFVGQAASRRFWIISVALPASKTPSRIIAHSVIVGIGAGAAIDKVAEASPIIKPPEVVSKRKG